ncbi:MAG: hypothetical protein ACPIOQ_03675 [Promethearchaeia archaeon]
MRRAVSRHRGKRGVRLMHVARPRACRMHGPPACGAKARAPLSAALMLPTCKQTHNQINVLAAEANDITA